MEIFMERFEFSRTALAMGVSLALTATSAQAIVIDNGIPIGTVDHWSVDVLSGGATQSVVTTTLNASGAVVTESIVSDFRVFVALGPNSPGVALQGSPPVRGDIFSPNTARSSGTIAGANGKIIRWETFSSVSASETAIITNYFFYSDGPIGPLRVYAYLDADIQGSDDDVFHFSNAVNISTVDDIEGFGIRLHGSTVGNATIAGFAADSFNRIQERITGPGQPVSMTAATVNLPNIQHPLLGSAYGPANVVSVLAWDVIPDHDAIGVSVDLIGDDFTTLGCNPSGCPVRPGPPPPVEPAKKQFSCRTSGCGVPITCNLSTPCDTKIDLFVDTKSIRLNDDTVVTKAVPRTKFAAAVATIPPGETVTVRPKLTKRGRTILRANRNKTIKGVMAIGNAVTGDPLSNTRVRIRLR